MQLTPSWPVSYSKVRLGIICDEEVTEVLKSRVQPKDVSGIELDRTVVICSTRRKCDEINSACITRVEGTEVVYEALDTDHMAPTSGS